MSASSSSSQPQAVDNMNVDEEDSQRNEKIELAVLKYLQQKGYHKALEALKSESNIKTYKSASEMAKETESSLNQEEASTAGSEVLFKYLASEETNGGRVSASRKYLHAYQSLTDWVYASLDIYKNELIQVLYPVFLHCYLELVSKGYREEALKFLNKYKTQHTHFHYDDILTLQSITSNEIIKQNEFAKRILQNKFVIRLSQASFELLMKFLQDSAELNLLSILNQYVNFKTYQGQPSLLAPAMTAESASILTIDLEKNYQRQQLRKKRKRQAALSAGQSVESESSDEEGDEDEDYISRLRRKKVYWEISEPASSITPSSAPATSIGESTGGLGGGLDGGLDGVGGPAGRKRRNKRITAQIDTETKSKTITAPKAAPIAPSVCFYTFFNCKNELNTIDLAPNYRAQNRGPVIAAGFNDSTIKCWNWDKPDDDQTAEEPYAADGSHTADSQYKTLHGHSGPVYSVNFSSDYKWLLSCSEDCSTRLWSVETGTNVVVYKGHQYSIWDVNFSPFDYLFATASHDRTARIWTTDRITPVRILAGHLSDVECVKFHPNCNYVATGSSDKTVRLWNVQSGECVRMFIGHYGAVHTLSFSNDGRYIASAGEDRSVFVWDIATAKCVYQFKGQHTDIVYSLDFSSDGSVLASGSGDNTIKTFHINKAQLQQQEEQELQLQKQGVAATSTSNPSLQSSTANCLKTYYTKETPVYKLKFVEKDILLGAGCFDL